MRSGTSHSRWPTVSTDHDETRHLRLMSRTRIASPVPLRSTTGSDMFEQQGFARTRQLGKNSWLVTKKVRPRLTSS